MSRLVAIGTLRNLSSTEFRVMYCLANHENDKTGQCNPCHKTIASECEISPRHAKKMIQQLRDKGVINIEHVFDSAKHNQLTNHYHFNFQKANYTSHKGELENTKGMANQSPRGCSTGRQGGMICKSPKSVNTIKSGNRIQEEDSTSPTPPCGGGICNTRERLGHIVPWPSKDEFKTWLNKIIIVIAGAIGLPPPSEVYSATLASFESANSMGHTDSSLNPIRDWKKYFTKIVRKECIKAGVDLSKVPLENLSTPKSNPPFYEHYKESI